MSQDLSAELGGGEQGSGPPGRLRAPCAMPPLVGTGRRARGGLGPGPSSGEEVRGFEGVGASLPHPNPWTCRLAFPATRPLAQHGRGGLRHLLEEVLACREHQAGF